MAVSSPVTLKCSFTLKISFKASGKQPFGFAGRYEMKPHRFFDRHHSTWVRRLLPGEFATAKRAESGDSDPKNRAALMTVLGSCVAVCLVDRASGLSGMNHFMLPEQIAVTSLDRASIDPSSKSARYGAYAMELLINELIARGARKDRFHAWIYGGGQILNGLTDIGESNVRFASSYLKREKIRIEGIDTGGILARKLYLDPVHDAPVCHHIEESLHRVSHRESRYTQSIAKTGALHKTDISLFEGA
jgi:chemotaxis protein CheD